jgi:hypothetical protein
VAKSKNWFYTSLAGDNSLVLTVEGAGDFKLAQFVASFGINDIPKATCMLAIGRDARNVDVRAQIHDAADKLTSLRKATVKFKPVGDYDADNEWPEGAKVIFDGYFAGFSYRKVAGKVQVVAQLIHWLVDLGFSSSLSSRTHPSNPTQLTFPAAMPQGAGSGGKAAFVAGLAGHKDLAMNVPADLWGAIKTYLSDVAQYDSWEPVAGVDACLGSGTIKQNGRALKALKRIEGPGMHGTALAYEHGKALPIFGGVQLIGEACASAIINEMTESMIHNTFWDVIVGQYCAGFALAVVPLVDTAIIVADTPGYRTPWTVTLKPDEYAMIDSNSLIPKPLKAVAVTADASSYTGANIGVTEREVLDKSLGGCFVSQAPEDDQGVLLVIAPPPWLQGITGVGEYAGASAGSNEASKTATTPEGVGRKPKDPTPGVMYDEANGAYSRYAQAVFIQNMLRGRSGSISGKLRFDIAPGSTIRIQSSPELFLGGEDELATDLFASVQRVTISINAESQEAETAFQLAHIRTKKENGEERTSADSHPLFGDAVVAGAPLVKDYLFV